MGDTLRNRLLQAKFAGPHHEASLNVLLAAHSLRDYWDRAFAGLDLTGPQYNVLRILNGAYPNGYARFEITRRMIDRAPDMTRMLDRLIERGLVERFRGDDDARRSMARITAKGRALLAKVNPLVAGQLDVIKTRLTVAEQKELSRLCERIYSADDE
ncbi:MAG: MarR family transcriptional regulator [Candidatus Eisenbacteria bacterium]